MKENTIVRNAKWIIVCKLAQSLLQLIIGMLSARYLGPKNYGLISYASSVVAFAVPFTQLGLNATLVRELVNNPEKEGEILGTSLIMSLFASVISVAAVVGFASIANKGERQTLIVCVLYSFSLVFQAIELIQYWFHSKLMSKYPSIAMLVAYVIVSAYKIYLLAAAKSVYWFAVVHVIEYGTVAFLLLAIYIKEGTKKLSISLQMAKLLFARSKYFILSSVMVTVFQNTDHIMLKLMSGDMENGYYTAAITCVTVCQFVYVAIIDSTRPVILEQKKRGSLDYEKYISRLYCIIIYLALAQGIFYLLFAKQIVSVLYGVEYMNAVRILQILVWYMAFSVMGKIRNIWILAEDKQSYLWKINLVGVFANVIINAILIPCWGAGGAALASLLTQFTVNFLIGFIYEPLKFNNKLLLKGLDPKLLLELVSEIKNRTEQ